MQLVVNNHNSRKGSLPSPLLKNTDRESVEQVISDLILRNDEYVERCILFLFHQQEEDEQARRKTIHRNGVGFNAPDARLFSPMAERLISGHSLSPDELAACRNLSEKGKPRLAKYWRQLLKAQNERLQ